MKKNSKAVEREAVETIGVDLGDKTSCYAILNEEGGWWRRECRGAAWRWRDRRSDRVRSRTRTARVTA